MTTDQPRAALEEKYIEKMRELATFLDTHWIGDRMTTDAFRAALERHGFSQAEFARFIEVDRQTVYRWAAGINPVPRTVELLLLMMKHIGIDRARKLAEGG